MHPRPSTATTVPSLCLVFGLLLWSPSRATAGFTLDFSVNGTLPSAQGLTYGIGVPSAVESQAFSVSGGLLHLNTAQLGSDVMAYYESLGSYSNTMDASMRVRARVTQTTSFFGVSFGFYDSVASNFFNVTATGWSILGTGASGTFATPGQFHDFDFRTFSATNSFEFRIDGVLVASGLRPGGFGGPSDVYFGDGTPTGGNMIADIAYVEYSELGVAESVPAPSGLALFALGGLTAWGLGRRRGGR